MMKKVLLQFGFALLLISCSKEKREDIFKGPVVAMHHGKAWSWAQINEQGAPLQLAIALDDAALHSLSTSASVGGEHQHEENFQIPLHPKAVTATPFRFIGSDWNPAGHDGPGGVYRKPHFDFHYYMTGEAELQGAVEPIKLDKHPEAEYLPQHYVPGPAVPKMGKHWIDVTSSELNGQPFTETFIYGSYDGKVTFYEPMITLDFLKTAAGFERAIPQPAKFKQAGYYPTRLRIEKRNGATEVILKGFEYRQAS